MSMAGGGSPFLALERCALFEGLARDELDAIAASMRPRTFEAGEVLCTAGDPGDRLFVVVDGLLSVVPAAEEAEGAAVARLRRGEVAGAESLVTGDPRSATVLAAAHSEVLELDRSAFSSLTERFPSILVNAVRLLQRRLTRANVRDERVRGEVVALLTGPSMAEIVPEALDAASSASPGPLAFLDARTGFHDAMARVDELLDGHRGVVTTGRAEGESAALLLERVEDRAVLLVSDEREVPQLAAHERVDMVAAPPARSTSPPGSGAISPAPGSGLALGAGGAKGYAHVGALQVLEEAGYPIDAVSGQQHRRDRRHATSRSDGRGRRSSVALRTAFDEEAVAATFSSGLGGARRAWRDGRSCARRRRARFEDPDPVRGHDRRPDLTARRGPPAPGPLWEALLAATAARGHVPAPRARRPPARGRPRACPRAHGGGHSSRGGRVGVGQPHPARRRWRPGPGSRPPPPPSPRGAARACSRPCSRSWTSRSSRRAPAHAASPTWSSRRASGPRAGATSSSPTSSWRGRGRPARRQLARAAGLAGLEAAASQVALSSHDHG